MHSTFTKKLRGMKTNLKHMGIPQLKSVADRELTREKSTQNFCGAKTIQLDKPGQLNKMDTSLQAIETCTQELRVLLQQVEKNKKRPYVVLDKHAELKNLFAAYEKETEEYTREHYEDRGNYVLSLIHAYSDLYNDRRMKKFEDSLFQVLGNWKCLRDFDIQLSGTHAESKKGKALVEALAKVKEEHARIMAIPLDKEEEFEDAWQTFYETDADELGNCILEYVKDRRFSSWEMKFVFPHIDTTAEAIKRVKYLM